MYPVNMTRAAVANAQAGFAVANDATEHAALSAMGYEPKLTKRHAEAKDMEPDDRESVMAALDAAGIDYDKRLGFDKLKALLG